MDSDAIDVLSRRMASGLLRRKAIGLTATAMATLFAAGGQSATRAASGQKTISKRGRKMDRSIRERGNGRGEVYVCDSRNTRIQRFGSDGVYLGQWGDPGSGDGEFTGPIGVAIGPGDTVLVADANSHRIQKFAPAGV